MNNTLGKLIHEEVVSPGSGTGGRIKAGQILRITDIEGQQVADFCSFMADNPEVYCDVIYSTFKARSWKLKEGDQLVSKHVDPMWTIVADDSNLHYSGGGFCSRDLNKLMGVHQHGCRDTLEEQLQKQNLSPIYLAPSACFNVFMNFPYEEDGTWEVKPPNTKAGDKIDLRAEADLIWAVSVCQFPGPCNGGNPSPLKFEIFDPH
ncbi:DUF1989 domain-containing protein [Pseudomonas tolaasii]